MDFVGEVESLIAKEDGLREKEEGEKESNQDMTRRRLHFGCVLHVSDNESGEETFSKT